MSQRPSAVMAALGIVQVGDAILRRPSQRFGLPGDAAAAREVVTALEKAAERVTSVHDFAKGCGVAAPQIGVDAAAAVVYFPGAAGPLVLLNPVVVAASSRVDVQFEGCLSFFDVRCRVPRPQAVTVEHDDFDGTRFVTSFERGDARMVLHEVDHVHGVLCTDHLRAGEAPVPVEEYRGTGSTWQY